MKTAPRIGRLLPILTLCLLALTACEDPSNVGLGLLLDEAEDFGPRSIEEAITDFAPDSLVRPPQVPERVLTGEVNDPLVGTVSAQGYIDFTPISSSDFRAGTVQSAELRLLPTYTYGDTTAEMTLAVRQVSVEWEDDVLPIDTTFNVGGVIREFTFRPTDSLVVVPMPATWVEANDDLLRSEEFGDDFHGFRFDRVSGNAVVGFSPTSTVLRAHTEEDSVSFPIAKAYSALSKDASAPPENRLIVQAGVGPEARFDFELDDTIDSSAVNRVALAFWTDTLAVQQNLPAGFVRPMIRTLDLYGITDAENAVLLARSNLDARGRFVFQSELLAREAQNTILGARSFDHFEIRIPSTSLPQDQSELALLPASISTALFYGEGTGERAPTAYLTLTPIDR